jgi:hypothetical protein
METSKSERAGKKVEQYVRVTATIKITELGLAKRAYVCNETELEPFSFLLECKYKQLCGVHMSMLSLLAV